jgi:uncharacterized membrane protein YkoI
MKTIIPSLIFTCFLTALLTGCATSQAELQAQAKVSQVDAEKTALAKAPGGTIKETELEKEHGKLVWSVEISVPGQRDLTEVHVDAITGDVVAIEKERP